MLKVVRGATVIICSTKWPDIIIIHDTLVHACTHTHTHAREHRPRVPSNWTNTTNQPTHTKQTKTNG